MVIPRFTIIITRADPGFQFRGAQNIMRVNAHYECKIRSPFRNVRQGARPGKLYGLFMLSLSLSCYLSLIFKAF